MNLRPRCSASYAKRKKQINETKNRPYFGAVKSLAAPMSSFQMISTHQFQFKLFLASKAAK
jgi:hypothetical protein